MSDAPKKREQDYTTRLKPRDAEALKKVKAHEGERYVIKYLLAHAKWSIVDRITGAEVFRHGNYSKTKSKQRELNLMGRISHGSEGEG